MKVLGVIALQRDRLRETMDASRDSVRTGLVCPSGIAGRLGIG